MIVILIIVGMLVGLVLGEAWLMSMLIGETRWLAVLTGAAIGGLWGLLIQQGRRIQTLERRFAEPAADSQAPGRTISPKNTTAAAAPRGPVTDAAEQLDPASGAGSASPATESNPDRPPRPKRRTDPPRIPARPSALARRLTGWFTSGNVPVKVGVLVSMVGVAALLRYVTEQGWLHFPIEWRLSGIAVFAIAMLLFGWRQREQRRIFGLSLQGGAVGILLLTIFAAFRFYPLLPAPAAFGLMVVLVAGTAVLAIRQNALGLAVLALLAGFAAPLLIASEDGHPALLFGWYAILNLTIFGVAWHRAWPILNRLGFIFTFGIGTLWGVLARSPEYFQLAQGFLLLFFALYYLMPILLLRRSERIDVLLVFGLPLFAVPLQIALLEASREPVALATMATALIYLVGAMAMYRHQAFRGLARAYAVLAIGLATLAVPFAFSGPTITLIWALQGAALVWFGCQQNHRLSRLSGLALQTLAGLVWLFALVLTSRHSLTPLLNPLFLGAMAVSLAGLVSAWRYQLAAASAWRINLLATWSLLFWLLGGISEIDIQLATTNQPEAMIVLFALTALIWAWLRRRFHWAMAGPIPAVSLAVCALLVFAQLDHGSPLAGWGIAAWFLVAAVSLWCDRMHAHPKERWRSWTALGSHLAIFTVLSVSAADWVLSGFGLGAGWAWMAGAAPVLALSAWMLLGRRVPLSLPPPARESQLAVHGLVVLALLLGLIASLASSGTTAPLPWLVVFNPLELTQLVTLLALTAAARRSDITAIALPRSLPPALLLLVASVMALRANHHLAGIDWQFQALMNSHQVQASLSVLWAFFGVIAWVIGSRRRQPLLWWSGAVLMGLVLLKLLIIDRLFLSTVAGIVSFLAFGLLSMLIGYLAPAPPRTRPTRETAP